LEDKLRKDYRIALIGGEELSLGFRLSGIKEAYTVESAAEAEAILKKVMQNDGIGLIVLSSKIANGIKDKKLLNAIDTSLLPLFVIVPEQNEKYTPDTLRRLILRAIGIDISKNIGN
jgi:vacuolar-type H+-ATPase subunit F/Vma7